MGLLSPEDVERLGQMIEGNGPPGQEEQQESVAVEAPGTSQVETLEVADTSSDNAQDVNQSAKEETSDASSPADEVEIEVEEGHRVPYSRFRQVLEARNKHRDELESLREKMTESEKERDMLQRMTMQRASESRVQPKATEDDWFQDLMGDEASPQATQQDPRYNQMASRLEAQEVALQQMKLEREIADATKRYPSADREAVLSAIYNDPSKSAMDVAEQYTSWLAGIEEAAIARHLGDNKQGEVVAAPDAQKPAAAPRPAKSGGGSVADFTGEKKPQTVTEGSAMFREFLKTHNPFA